ncbi:MAG: hypothetical protein ABW321_21930 [Polyangiales bacterium]
MMLDPERLLSPESDAALLERELLQQMRQLSAPIQVREPTWQGILREIERCGTAGLMLPAQSSAQLGAATAALSGQLTKAAPSKPARLRWFARKRIVRATRSQQPRGAARGHVVVRLARALIAGLQRRRTLGTLAVALCVAVALTSAWLQAHDQLPLPAASRHLTPTPPEPSEAGSISPEPAAQPAGLGPSAPEPSVARKPSPPTKRATSAAALALAAADQAQDSEHAYQRELESWLVYRARARLRAGRIAEAEADLEKLRRRVPHGTQMRKREILTIQLFEAQGRHELAVSRAQAFAAKHPQSQLLPQLQPLLAAARAD